MSEKLVLIDGHSILNRAFFGLPDLTNSKGLHTNAVYGFLNILFKLLEEEQPDYLTVAFDVHAPTFRHKMFEAYKGTRGPMDDALKQQVPLMKEMLSKMGIRIIEKEGYEADDVLGTLAGLGEKAGMEVSVVSGDRDLLQLATEHVRIRIPKTKKTGTEIEDYYAKDVKERYQVTPKEFIDVKALMGDSSDNIPGVLGIGEKTAVALISQYGSIEEVYAHAGEVKPPRASKNIVEFWEQAKMSKELATIITDVPIETSFEGARISSVSQLYTNEAYLLCKELEFKKLLDRFSRTVSVEEVLSDVFDSFQVITEKEKFHEVLNRAKDLPLAFSLIGTGGNEQGVALAFSKEEHYLVMTGEELSLSDVMRGLEKGKQPLLSADLKQSIPLFEGLSVEQMNRNWEEYEALRSRFFDRTIAAYLINPLAGEYSYDLIAKDYLNEMLPTREDVLGKKGNQTNPKEQTKAFMRLACYEAYVTQTSYGILLDRLKELGMEELYSKMEMPLVFVLKDMEREGISLDTDALKEYGKKLQISIEELQKKIYEEAGEEFNINSPKQLGVILFEKLGLPYGKKTKTGYSTSAEVLEKLAPSAPIVADILEYRQLSKLKSTYADGLLSYVEEDGKIRTTFHQTITATGRLSSADPNLQNIPIRIELGRLIRKVFHPTEGNVFVDSDYSQIELRLLAHMSGDEALIRAFREGQDIHRSTASLVFHTPYEEVTSLQRRNAKAVNFGIVYGISAFGLSQDLDIGRKEAQEYIDSYFETYPRIKAFLEQCVSDAKRDGYTKTLYGRIRPIPELSSSNFMQRQFGERVAMNAPIQGTAADIMKLAMIRVHDRLFREGFASRLILQVHDELLIETKKEEREAVIALLEEEMQKAAQLSVALEVGTAYGDTWFDAH